MNNIPPDWLRKIVFETSVAYNKAILEGYSVQESEFIRMKILENKWKEYLNGQ